MYILFAGMHCMLLIFASQRFCCWQKSLICTLGCSVRDTDTDADNYGKFNLIFE